MHRGVKVALLFLCTILLAACAGAGKPCSDLLQDFCREYENLPTGHCYYREAEEWEKEALPTDMASILFTEDNGENAFSLCTDYAIFLSSAYGGGEAAFLRADSQGDALRLTEMCTARIARVGHTLPGTPITQGACVLRHGPYVVLLMMPNNEEAKEVCHALF